MNSAVNTLGTASQASVSGNQINKTMHAQGTTSFGQPSHISPGLGAMHTNTNVAHSHPNQQHHYSMNVPNAAGHYMNQNLGQIPASNHPVANASSTAAGQGYNLQKNASNYLSNYQPNLAHQQNQSTGTPVSQPLPSSLSSQTNVNNVDATSGNSEQRHAENSQSNGTSEVKSAQKIESTSSPLNAKEKSVQPAPVPELPQVKEKSPAPAQTTTQQVQSDAAETPDSITTSVQTPSSDAKASPTNSSVIPQTETSSTASLPTNANFTNQKETSEPKKVECIESEPEPKKPEVEEKSKPVQQTEKLEEDSVESKEEDKVENSSSPVTAESNITEEKSVPKEKGGPKDETTPKQINSTTENTIKTPTRKTKSHSNKPDESTKTLKDTKVAAPKILSTSKTKRRRIRTQPYQSPLPEVELISKISSLTPRTPRNSDDKLIVFYKNEFLAVRNAEGSFYLCQAVQNIYKSSSKIKIRWLSQDKSDKTGEIYTPDFYDLTDFDCILTNLSLNRIEKGKFRLPPSENERTLSILNRSLAVEKGEVSSPSLTEEHPDGLDLSLYRDEDQLKKRRAKKRKAGRKPSNIRNAEKKTPTKKSPEASKVRKVPLIAKASGKITVPKKTEQLIKKSSESKKSETSLNRASGRGKRKVETNLSPVVDQKKAKVLAKIGKKSSIAVSKTVQSSTKNVKSGNKTTSSSKKTPHAKTSLNSSVKPTPRNARRSTRK